MAFNKKQVQVGSIRLTYLGKTGTGTVIIALHGNSCSSESWHQFLEDSAKTDYRIIVPDLPGHGTSDKATDPENDYTIGGLANIIKQFIDVLEIESYICIGHSLGGHIAYNLLVNDPRLNQAITFAAPPVSLPLEDSLPLAYLPNPAFSNLFKGDLTESDIHETAVSFDPHPMPFVYDAIRNTDPEFRIRFGQSVGTLNGMQDEFNVVNRNKDRVILIVNTKDRIVNPTYYDRFNSSMCCMVEVENHSPHHLKNWMLQVLEESIAT